MSSADTYSIPDRQRPRPDAAPLYETLGATPAPVGTLRVPELVAPAGDWDCVRAAVENGADAVYFGLEKFNARMRAHNFTEADLPKLMEFLHRRGVKGYVTFNTLVFEEEMAQAEEFLRAVIAAGVDAAVVQDVGVCRLIRQLSPDFPIHASTQMTVTSAVGLEFARQLGCRRVVLARECSLLEIAVMVESAECRGQSVEGGGVGVEVFIHGALCVAYSGQCLTSEALGGRSANRGECAQACRLPYDLIADGKLVPLGDRKYLLSPRDLAGLEVLPELVRAGVAALKIEGRLKSPEYVASITRVYRAAMDALRDGPPGAGAAPAVPDARYEMEMAFSRGLHTGWLRGTNNQELVHGRFGKKRGVYLGAVAAVQRESVFVELQGPLQPGDGVVFDAGQPEAEEQGGRVYEIKPAPSAGQRQASGRADGPPLVLPPNAGRMAATNAGARVHLFFGRGRIDFRRVHVGDKVWKTSDPELERRLRQSYAGDSPRFQQPIALEAHGRAGAPLTLIARDAAGHAARAESAMPLAAAEKQALTAERLREQLGRLGGTPFKLGELKNCLAGDVLLPLSELNRLRRELARALETLRAQPQRWTLRDRTPGAERPASAADPSPAGPQLDPLPDGSRARRPCPAGPVPATPHLIVLVRELAQLEAALKCGVETIYCEFEDPKKYREAVSHFRSSAPRAPRSAIYVAPPRIFKTGEEWILQQVRASEADGYLLRNYDHLTFFAGERHCVGDYSLNIANHLAAEYFRDRFALERLTASYDLNAAQLEGLLRAAPPQWFEVTLHQHIPMFHLEHCVFCACLSNGTDYRNCGRPCDRHDLKLRDRVGAQHPVKADAGCRNTVFHALAQTGADSAARLVALGARHFRLEFLTESPALVERTIGMYRQLLRGEITGPQLWRELKLLNQLGVTRGPRADKAAPEPGGTGSAGVQP